MAKIAVDTSVVVAAFASWHELHEQAVRVVARRPLLPAQCACEAYSVLTRLPAPHRVSPEIAIDHLRRQYRGEYIQLGPRALAALLGELAEIGIAGGAVYDALVARAAREGNATLATCDRRALGTYAVLGVDIHPIGV